MERKDTILAVIDVQEKFRPVIFEWDRMLENTVKLIKGFHIMGIPILVTEQYPKGLGETITEVKEALGNFNPIEKTSFSCVKESGFIDELKRSDAKHIVLCGIESHICLLNTTLDLIKEGYEVHYVVDAVSSRKKKDYDIAVERVRQAGAFLASTEMILFQLLKDAKSDEFKDIQKIVK